MRVPRVWPFGGFYSPVNNRPVVNAVKAGSTVPIKFSLGGYRGMDVLDDPVSQRMNVLDGVVVDWIEELVETPGSSALTYDTTTQRYQYNWKTSKDWSGTYRQFVLKLDDGTARRIDFQLR